MASADHGYTIHFLEDNKTIMVGECCTVINITIENEAYEQMSKKKGDLQSPLSFNWSDTDTLDEKMFTKIVKLNVINPFDEFFLDVYDGFVGNKFALTRDFIEGLYKRYRARLLKIRNGCIALEVGFSDMALFNQFQENQVEVCKMCEDFLTKCCKRDVTIRLTIQNDDLSMDNNSLSKRHETGFTQDYSTEEQLKGELKEEQQRTLQKLRELVLRRYQSGLSQELDPSKDLPKQVRTLEHPSWLGAPGRFADVYTVQRADQPHSEDVGRKPAETAEQSDQSLRSVSDSGFQSSEKFQQEQHRTPREFTTDLRQSPQESPVDTKVPVGPQTSSGKLDPDVSDEDVELYELHGSDGKSYPSRADQPHSEDVGGKPAETAEQSEQSLRSVSDSGFQSSEKFQQEQHRTPREFTIDLRSDRQSPTESPVYAKAPVGPQTSSGKLDPDVTDEDVELYELHSTEANQPHSEDVGGKPFHSQHQRTPREYKIDLRASLGRRRLEEQVGQQSAIREVDLSLSPAQLTFTGYGPEAVKEEDKTGDDVHHSGKKRDVHAVESPSLSSLQVEVASGVGKSERTVAPSNLSDKFENPKLPPLGTRVIRGKDWKYGEQDAYGPGTIYAHDKFKNYVWVLWDGGQHNCYRYNRKKAFDVKTVEDQPRSPSLKHSFEIGVRVRQVDLSTPSSRTSHTETGVVIRRDDSGAVMVRWSNGKMTEHHSEQGRIRDIVIGDDIPERVLTEVSQRIPTVQDLSRSPHAVKEKTKNIWRWKDKGGNWHCYPQRLQETIEQEYQKKPSGSLLIRKSRKCVRIRLTPGSMEEEDLTTGERLPIYRQAVDADEYQALIPAE